MPDKKHIIISLYGMMGAYPGRIMLMDSTSDQVTELYTGNEPLSSNHLTNWGSADCQRGDTFSPHGIDLSRREDGSLQLLVVNHNKQRNRETVEIFEVAIKPMPQLFWRGCVALPSNSVLNDVAALPGNGFVVTQAFDQNTKPFWGRIKLYLGLDSGHVWQWTSKDGLSVVPGSQGAGPNGIAASEDGQFIFVNYWVGNEIRKIDRRTGEVMGTIETLHPDNSSWTEDGTLLVTYHPASMESVFRCHEIKEGACGVPFEVLEVNPKLMQSSPVLRSPIGAGTTAIKVGSQLYIGSSSGDRLFKAPMEYGVQTYARSQN